jgi:2-dehydro-3-deoxyphosphogluconate aldolase/(4S)-4-hydroxy-2-oxoglutarate aldolase
MNSETSLRMIERCGVITVLRGKFPPAVALDVAQALINAGLDVFEFTMNSEQPLEAMRAVKDAFGDSVCVGMGTVLTPAMAQHALDADADMIVAPSFDPAVIALCHSQHVLAVPGVMTPTEIVNAWESGARLVKLFPMGTLGIDYLKAVLGPLNHISFICNGGIDDQNIGAFLKAGAKACGMGSWLTGDGSMPIEQITQRAHLLRSIVDAARTGQPSPRMA